MLNELFAVIAPMLICASNGVFWVRSGADYPADFVSRAVMNIGAPCLIISTLGQVAGMVVMSTLLAFVCPPFLVSYVLILSVLAHYS